MLLLDHSANKPAQNLALDEALLEMCEQGLSDDILRIWESPEYFVVLGCASRAEEEVSLNAASELGIPVLRRVSGGCSVIQGPGCLNYSLVLRTDKASTETISAANRYIMEKQRSALEQLLIKPVKLQGDTDLTFAGKKFSGNSQRRLRKCLLFHGTLLYNFDLSLIERVLNIPKRQPQYRKERTHCSFLTNINANPVQLKETLSKTWNVRKALARIPENEVDRLVNEKYSKSTWNMRR